MRYHFNIKPQAATNRLWRDDPATMELNSELSLGWRPGCSSSSFSREQRCAPLLQLCPVGANRGTALLKGQAVLLFLMEAREARKKQIEGCMGQYIISGVPYHRATDRYRTTWYLAAEIKKNDNTFFLKNSGFSPS